METINDVRSISRVDLSGLVSNEEALMRGDVIERARKLLHYDGSVFDAAGPLSKVLCKLEIQPLNTAQVMAYMKSKEGWKAKDNSNWFTRLRKEYWRWEVAALGRGSTPRTPTYGQYVPVHVLHTAVRVHESMSNVGLQVHYLTNEQVNDPDPFLAVTFGSEVYFVEVWDEREFEARM